MGTSTSSKGGGAGSPFDPEWLDAAGSDAGHGGDPGAPESGNGGSQVDVGGTGTASGEDAATGAEDGAAANVGAFAPDRRFAQARSKMSTYLSGGGRPALREAARNMVTRGMGGAGRAASTMSRTASGAGQLGQFLAAARDGSDTRVLDWVQKVRNADLSANDLVLELVREVLPDTGSVDDESLRNAAAEALGQLLESEPDIDVFALTDQQIADVVGFTVANDVCNRMDLLLGQTYERLKFDPKQVQVYRNDMKEFVHAEVRVILDQLGTAHVNPRQLAKTVLASTLKVFAE